MARKRVIIVGSGPAGLFAALELSLNPEIEVLIFEKRSRCGGAGTNSDGKLVLSSEVGGHMAEIVGEYRFRKLMAVVNKTFTQFGGEQKIYEKNHKKIKELVQTAASLDMRLVPTRTRHFGSDNAPIIVNNIKEELERRGVKIYLNTPVESIETRENGTFLVKTGGNAPETFESEYVIVATGRDRTGWLVKLAKILGLNTVKGDPVDYGVRVEVPAYVFKPVDDYLYDPKLIIKKTKCTGDYVRTFCHCPRGEVITETESGLTLVNGHSLERDPSKKTNNTNFAILVSSVFRDGFDKPFEFAKKIAELGNDLAVDKKVLVQRLGDLTAPREKRTWPSELIEIQDFIVPTLKSAFPGDIGEFFPYRKMRSILEMLERLNKMVPGVWSDHTLLYAPEVKFYSNRIESSQDLETAIRGLFAVGDGAGISRGILHASISGMVAAQAIIKRIK